ncbi:hypothetical protein JCM19241_4986 [Vibrio ishigakensis]|uniref:Uncharacterized protein n=1 Tax=Vibrio ishigakensis TaxID=1481914 RepID=A0A0B8Q2Q3_9VIBR|nr:hypothetical protein JCM19241_4986 [Vibrio ishigakensis]
MLSISIVTYQNNINELKACLSSFIDSAWLIECASMKTLKNRC